MSWCNFRHLLYETWFAMWHRKWCGPFFIMDGRCVANEEVQEERKNQKKNSSKNLNCRHFARNQVYFVCIFRFPFKEHNNNASKSTQLHVNISIYSCRFMFDCNSWQFNAQSLMFHRVTTLQTKKNPNKSVYVWTKQKTQIHYIRMIAILFSTARHMNCWLIH